MEHDFVLRFKDPNALDYTKEVKSGIKDDDGKQIHFSGTAHGVGWERKNLTPWDDGYTYFYIKHLEPAWVQYDRLLQEEILFRGYKPLTTEEKEARDKEIEQNYPLTAEDVWHRCVDLDTDELFRSYGWVGQFAGTPAGVAFACSDGCCDEYWNNKEEFLNSHKDDMFKIEE